MYAFHLDFSMPDSWKMKLYYVAGNLQLFKKILEMNNVLFLIFVALNKSFTV